MRTLLSIPLRVLLLTHAVGAGIYCWLQPRGFPFGSPQHIEHELLVPALFAVSLAAIVGVIMHRPLAFLSTAVLAGFWLAVAGTIGVVGTTVYAVRTLAVFPFAAFLSGILFVAARRMRAWVGLSIGGLVVGLLGGTAFLFCSWAPEATTRPAGESLDLPEAGQGARELRVGDTLVRVRSAAIVIETPAGSLVVEALPRFPMSARSGFWTLFDAQTVEPPAWEVLGTAGPRLVLRAEDGRMRGKGIVRVTGRTVRIVFSVTLRHEIAAHLADTIRINCAGPVTIDGEPLPNWTGAEPQEFVAFREGRLERLRSDRRENGPYTTLTSWPPHDPRVRTGPWIVHVKGWADQASRAPSPTAGWGVSQGTIEVVGHQIYWTLASTSVGLGWHTVRTAAGAYSFEILLERP